MQNYSDFEQQKRSEIIGVLFGAFGQAGDSNRLTIYTKMLKDIPSSALEKVCRKLMLESRFLPTIADIVSATKSLMGTADEAQRTREWDEALAEIERAMQRTPWGSYPVFSRPEIAMAVESFGWYNLQTCLAEDINTVRAQLRRIYEDVCKRTAERGHNEYVLGKSKSGLLQPSARTRKDLELLKAGELKKSVSQGLTRVSTCCYTMPMPPPPPGSKSKGKTFAEWKAERVKENDG